MAERQFYRAVSFIKGKEKPKAVQVGYGYENEKGDVVVVIETPPLPGLWDGRVILNKSQSNGSMEGRGGGQRANAPKIEDEDIPF